MSVTIYQVDAFTDKPFAGNPAGVCLLSVPHSAEWMQNVAKEMNLAETAFLRATGDDFSLRWFTPTVEVDLCGHATLASAHILWETGTLAPNAHARFHTRSGLLTAHLLGQEIELDFPATPAQEIDPPPELERALGTPFVYVGKSKFDYLVQVGSESTVRGLQPDFALLKTMPVRGTIVTSLVVSPEFDFVSRFFAPAAGIDEDPVTGSAHCCLGPHWHTLLGKDKLLAYQASERGGIVRVRVDADTGRVRLGGRAVTVFRAELSAKARAEE